MLPYNLLIPKSILIVFQASQIIVPQDEIEGWVVMCPVPLDVETTFAIDESGKPMAKGGRNSLGIDRLSMYACARTIGSAIGGDRGEEPPASRAAAFDILRLAAALLVSPGGLLTMKRTEPLPVVGGLE